ncbi:MAG: trypsin-like peptidase domain-containing protein [Bacteroidetes bacterium]|nr:trypsin-like peptidase domain-containing protein [Bacteroidota bacterium]
MNTSKFLLIATSIFTFGNAMAQDDAWFLHKDDKTRGSFGADTRAEANTKWQYREYMRATATMFDTRYTTIKGDKISSYTLEKKLLSQFGGVKPDPSVKFLDQPASGSCTGFLIAPDILVTAGHCLDDAETIKNAVWVFDYTADVYFDKSTGYITIPQSNQYRIAEVLAQSFTGIEDSKYDYCVVRLDRPTNRKPYKFRTSKKVKQNQYVAMIGSPKGLPLKLADSAMVTNADGGPTTQSFYTDLDAFHGNSGGPVFNLNGFIEGILVRGIGNDYHVDESCNCLKQDVNYDIYSWLGRPARQGNAVHRITDVPWNLLELAIYRNLEYSLQNDNFTEFAEWTLQSWILGEKIEGRENLLSLAAKSGKTQFLDTLLGLKTADVNIRDLSGIPLANAMAMNNMAGSIKKAALRKEFDVNAKDAAGETALMVAARYGSLESVKALLNAGADPKLTSNAGQTARSIAKKAKQRDCSKVLKSAEKGKYKG